MDDGEVKNPTVLSTCCLEIADEMKRGALGPRKSPLAVRLLPNRQRTGFISFYVFAVFPLKRKF